MRAFDIYEHPSFEMPSKKEQSFVYAVLGAAVAVGSTIAAVSLNGLTSQWIADQYVRIVCTTLFVRPLICMLHSVMRSF